MREEEPMSTRTESEAYRGHRTYMWFFLGAAVFLLLEAVIEMLFGPGYPLMFVSGALAAAALFWQESRRQRQAEREHGEGG